MNSFWKRRGVSVSNGRFPSRPTILPKDTLSKYPQTYPQTYSEMFQRPQWQYEKLEQQRSRTNFLWLLYFVVYKGVIAPEMVMGFPFMGRRDSACDESSAGPTRGSSDSQSRPSTASTEGLHIPLELCTGLLIVLLVLQ